MPDLLYGELDDERAANVRGQIAESAELSSTLASYEALRAAFRELPEEEPPSFISAQLMHEAAKHAGGPRAAAADDGGVWVRIRDWFGALSARPGLAAAASLAVLLGLGSIIYMRGGDQIAQPEPPARSTSAPAPAPAPDEAEREIAPTEGARAVDTTTTVDAEDPSDGVGIVGGVSDLKDSKRAAPRPTRKRTAKKRTESKSKSSSSRGRSRGSGGAKEAAPAQSPPPAPAKPRPEPTAPPPSEAGKLDDAPVAPGPVAPAAEPEASEEADFDKAPAQKAPPRPSSKVKDLHASAAVAAKAGDCARARKLASQIKALDGAYYRDVFTRDSRIKPCLAR